MLYVYGCLGIYLLIALPLTFLLYTTAVAAKWGDNDRDMDTDMENEFRWMPQ
ncbi:MAG: hypothetical protein AB1649_33770 [Chloroflexota bacterium]